MHTLALALHVLLALALLLRAALLGLSAQLHWALATRLPAAHCPLAQGACSAEGAPCTLGGAIK